MIPTSPRATPLPAVVAQPPTLPKTSPVLPSTPTPLAATTRGFYEYTSTGTSLAFQGSWAQPVGAFDHATVGDFNGDGKADVAIHDNNAIHVYLSNGRGFDFAGSWVSPVGAIDYLGAGDFNGDGKSDIVIHDANT